MAMPETAETPVPDELLESGEPLVYSIKGAARALAVSEHTVRRRIAAGDLPARRVGGQWRIPRVALVRYLETT